MRFEKLPVCHYKFIIWMYGGLSCTFTAIIMHKKTHKIKFTYLVVVILFLLDSTFVSQRIQQSRPQQGETRGQSSLSTRHEEQTENNPNTHYSPTLLLRSAGKLQMHKVSFSLISTFWCSLLAFWFWLYRWKTNTQKTH